MGIWKQNSCGLLFAVSACAGIVVVFLVKNIPGMFKLFVFLFFHQTISQYMLPVDWRRRVKEPDEQVSTPRQKRSRGLEQSKRRCVRGNPSRLLSCSKPAGWTAKTAWEVSLNHWGWTLFLYCQWEGADILLFFLTRQFRLVPPCPAPSALPLAETLCSRLACSCVTVPLHLL